MHNYLKTILLLGVLSTFVIIAGSVIGGKEGLYMAFFLSLVLNIGSYFFSDKIALAASRAVPLSRDQSPQLFLMVEDLSNKLAIPMPKLFIIKSPQANAFATGRDPNNSAVAVTEGLLHTLSESEVKAVIAHELGHIKNRDILTASIAAVLASSITVLSRMGMFGGGRGSNENRSLGALSLVFALLAPIAGLLIQFAISREREFEADDSSKELLGSGQPLETALLKIHDSARRSPMDINPSFAGLFIGDPFGGLGGKFAELFSTHPPVEKRISRLRQIS